MKAQLFMEIGWGVGAWIKEIPYPVANGSYLRPFSVELTDDRFFFESEFFVVSMTVIDVEKGYVRLFVSEDESIFFNDGEREKGVDLEYVEWFISGLKRAGWQQVKKNPFPSDNPTA